MEMMEKITDNDLSVEILHDGSLRVSCFIGIVWRHRRYYDYTKQEAINAFKKDVSKFIL
jgi:hypothetical protein